MDDLIESFLSGDMGSVEFFELALEAGMSLERINEVLAEADEND